jgi:hypothetical protein
MIETLIDKQDTFELVRDKIAAILAIETNSQQQLAGDECKDPKQWKFRVYSERSNPVEAFQSVENAAVDRSPIVNIWWDDLTPRAAASNNNEKQDVDGIYNIDCYGVGVSSDDNKGGQIPGDESAALEMQRVVRLVRNILMASEYRFLELQGLVGQRWVQNIKSFQPEQDGNQAQHVVASRIAFKVRFNEFSPQIVPEILESVNVDVIRAEDGEIVLEADYPAT